MGKQLNCGAYRIKITPSEELIPNLRGLKDTSFGGVVDDIYIRVIAFGDGENKTLIISFDLDKAPYPKESIATISECTGIPEDNILFFGIHTHSAPVTGFRPFEKFNDITKKPIEVQEATKQYEKFIMDNLLKAVNEAINRMQPAKTGYGYGNSYINVNRNQDYVIIDENGNESIECSIGVNPEKPVDRTLFVMKVEDMSGKPIAFFVNYAVHNVVMIWNCCGEGGKVGISSDLGGNVMQHIEAKFDDSVAIWSSGAAGDVNPIMSNELFYPDPMTGRPTQYSPSNGDTPIAMLKILSTRHFADIMSVLRKIDVTRSETSIACTVEWSNTPGRSTDGQENTEPYMIRLHLIRIGDVVMYGISGELFSSLGLRIKEISPMKNTIVINHDASLMVNGGYIYDDEAFRHNEKTLGGIVGINNTRMLQGYFEKSLEEHTINMFKKIMSD